MKQKNQTEHYLPLATRMRPRVLTEYIGQTHLLGSNKPLTRAILLGQLHSMIFWGPPGTGKTTLARLIANHAKSRFVQLSAINAGVKEIRQTVDEAQFVRSQEQIGTILFIDEIHRFNKSQQDVLLPYIENGTFILIGATTENPSFELNNALLSRARVYVLKRMTEDELLQILDRAMTDIEFGLGALCIDFPHVLRKTLVTAADGDSRQVLTLLEVIADGMTETDGKRVVTEKDLTDVLQASLRRFDKGGEAFYDQISALHKSVRGSNPDAALYWLCRMMEGGCDPSYLARRVIRMAVEDIGLADPRGLELALQAATVYERLGSPEGELALAEAVIYLSVAPKSNAVYTAYSDAMHAAKKFGSLDVPIHLRNAPTKLMKEIGYGKNYRYAHDEHDAYAAGEVYLPKELKSEKFYHPTSRGLEEKIKEKLEYLAKRDKANTN